MQGPVPVRSCYFLVRGRVCDDEVTVEHDQVSQWAEDLSWACTP